MARRGLTMRRLEPPSPDVERREGAARKARPRRARREIEFLAAGPAGYPFSRRS